MELSSIKHIDPDQIADYKADLFITTLGFESRSTQVARHFEGHSCRKVALQSKNPVRDFSYQDNRSYLEDQGFEFIDVHNDVPDLAGLLRSFTGDSLNLVIDCTSMPPLWYYEFLSWFDRKHSMEGRVRLRMAYTMAAYAGKSGSRKVKKIMDFLKEESKPASHKKTALILGLGQEKQVSDAIFHMINPDLLYLFYADPPAEKRFVEKVFVNNHHLINEVPIRNLVAYPVRNGQVIYQSLINTILPLRNEYSIVLIPHGPKIFSVISILVHLGYPDIRISYPHFKKQKLSDRMPKDEPVVLDILFEGEE
jgi:hypothetical protein